MFKANGVGRLLNTALYNKDSTENFTPISAFSGGLLIVVVFTIYAGFIAHRFVMSLVAAHTLSTNAPKQTRSGA
ncbi:hypothetical protein MGMO_54c00170 [Methyloglobulus morosus KoM1]|uniref:Uncharacterized protein n=1 Tax=Methyloglobulus morosus KoM1 TaxID=1116472 RepID=V5C722_9GAMM|nr:hypothetical protein MGMO_54c00170 [Methyloglobulus morosus KoM1]